jgi:hypothetical protein
MTEKIPLMNSKVNYTDNLSLHDRISNYLLSFKKTINHNILVIGPPGSGKNSIIKYIGSLLNSESYNKKDNGSYYLISFNKKSLLKFNFIVPKNVHRQNSQLEVINNIRKIPEISRNYIDLILIVHDLSKTRFDEEDHFIIKNLSMIFDSYQKKEILDKVLVLFNKSYNVFDYNLENFDVDNNVLNKLNEYIEEDRENFEKHVDERKNDFQNIFQKYFENMSLLQECFVLISKIKKNNIDTIPKYNISRCMTENFNINNKMKSLVNNKKNILVDNWLQVFWIGIMSMPINPLFKLSCYYLLYYNNLITITFDNITRFVNNALYSKPTPHPEISFCSRCCKRCCDKICSACQASRTRGRKIILGTVLVVGTVCTWLHITRSN